MGNRNRPHEEGGLSELASKLLQQNGLTVDEVSSFLRARDIRITDADVQQYLSVDSSSYKRNLVLETDSVQLLVLCWKPGQGSKIHDHGNSNCGIRVLCGNADETLYGGTVAEPVELSTKQHGVGDVTANDGKLIHKVENRSEDLLVTLHIYSPPLIRMNG
jgi:cysteine dioxygenase